MTPIEIAAQTLLPLALLVLLWSLRHARPIFFWTAVLSVALVVAAIRMTVFHSVVPGWTVWLWVALLLGTILRRMRKRSGPIQPLHRLHRIGLPVAAILGLYGAVLLAQGFIGRTPPAGDVVDLAMPLGPGRYIVAHGGAHEAVNLHYKTLDETVPRFTAWRGQSHAVDLLGLTRFDTTHSLLDPGDLSGHAIYGRSVHAPCAGVVLAMRRDRPDNIPPAMDPIPREGNYVLLDCDGVHVLMAHFRQGSLVVEAGQNVENGSFLGEVGNSGASTAPHLHIHAQTPGTPEEPFSGTPLHIRLDGTFPVRNRQMSGRAWR